MENQNLSLCVLISCMYQDTSIIERTRVQTNVVVVNQCDEEKVEEFYFNNTCGQKCHALFICTKERGLSRSRNMAINKCECDICLLCDDDEFLHDGYEKLIFEGYHDFPNASLIAFSLNRKDINKEYPREMGPLKFRQIMKTSSLQLTFRKRDLEKNGILFDVNLGSGSGNGGGEENKFQLDFKKNGLKIYYHPNCIATVNPGNSQWFHGYTPDYFMNWGWSIRRIFGIKSLVFVPYFVFSHRKRYDSISFLQALKYSFLGWLSKRDTK